MKALLFENGGLASQKIYDWVESFVGKDYKEINTEVRDYERRQDLWMFATLINPEIEHIFVSLAFERQVDFHCHLSFKGIKRIDDPIMLQVEYYGFLIREAVVYRQRHNLPKLTLHVNYLYPTLFEDLKDGTLGDNLILLTIRQMEGWLTVIHYDDYKEVGRIIEDNNDYKYITK
jgi:hypothetical protein